MKVTTQLVKCLSFRNDIFKHNSQNCDIILNTMGSNQTLKNIVYIKGLDFNNIQTIKDLSGKLKPLDGDNRIGDFHEINRGADQMIWVKDRLANKLQDEVLKEISQPHLEKFLSTFNAQAKTGEIVSARACPQLADLFNYLDLVLIHGASIKSRLQTAFRTINQAMQGDIAKLIPVINTLKEQATDMLENIAKSIPEQKAIIEAIAGRWDMILRTEA